MNERMGKGTKERILITGQNEMSDRGVDNCSLNNKRGICIEGNLIFSNLSHLFSVYLVKGDFLKGMQPVPFVRVS